MIDHRHQGKFPLSDFIKYSVGTIEIGVEEARQIGCAESLFIAIHAPQITITRSVQPF